MIVFEDRIEDLINLIPNINGFKTHFYWGKDGKDVNRYLVSNDSPYPFVFLTQGTERGDVSAKEVLRDCRFILACQEFDLDKMNDQRLLDSYKDFLNPLAAYMLELFDVSTISRINEGKYRLKRVPNYSESNENPQIDKWDVIVLELELVLNNNCLKPIVWE
ncbi:hypothetical protein QO206_13295 [Leeuwenhoekiella aequorea]|uniref:hypothetical protein n=1 Tax=Leeuwenhoekiella aequorea TaxID=283736 RepID=UPI00352E092F|tara:strand:+ start:20292 stop:20777 length:486 start_codon:yes stop_codon:yes gene_type:complete